MNGASGGVQRPHRRGRVELPADLADVFEAVAEVRLHLGLRAEVVRLPRVDGKQHLVALDVFGDERLGDRVVRAEGRLDPLGRRLLASGVLRDEPGSALKYASGNDPRSSGA
jgi:hypothetical protein